MRKKVAPMLSSVDRDERDLTVSDFALVRTVTTRWSDNDMYGHLNNAVYVQLFDAVINGWIIEETGFDPTAAAAIGVVAETGCRYFREVTYPHDVLDE